MTKIIKKKIKAERIAILCAKMGVSRTTIIAAIERGEIPVVQIGDGLDLLEPDDLAAWIKRGPDRPQGRPVTQPSSG